MPIQLKSIYDKASPDDGHRVLATQYWPRGIRKTAVDEYVRALAPSRDLLRAYKDGAASWSDFARRYREEIAGRPEAAEHIEHLRTLARDRTVTLMCTCRDSDTCHRSLLSQLIEV